MSNGKYDVIRPQAVNLSPAQDWEDKALEVFKSERDRAERNDIRGEEQRRYDQSREDMLFQQKYEKSVAAYESQLNEYNIASEQIGSESPDMLRKLQQKYSKNHLIPKRDGTFEKRFIVPEGVKLYTDEKVKSKSDFDMKLDNWKDMTNEQKIAAWPSLKKNNRYFNVDLDIEEGQYNKALSYRDNEKLLDSMGQFLPQGYSNDSWEGAKKILLKDDDVTDAELKLIAADMSKHITNKESAREFWSKLNTELVKSMGDVTLETPPTVVNDLQRMQEVVNQNLSEFYPDMTETTDRGAFNARVSEIVKEKYGADGDFDSLSPEQQKEIVTQVATGKAIKAGITAGFESDKDESTEEAKKLANKKETLDEKVKPSWISPKGASVKNPVTKEYGWSAEMMAKAVKESPFTYANKGLIPSDDYPGFKEVSIKEALEHYQKNKSKYKKDKPIKVSQGLFRNKKDITRYPKSK